MTSPQLTPQMLADLGDHLYREGVSAYQRKDYKEALIWFSQCLTVCREFQDAESTIGRILFFMGAIYSFLKNGEQMMAFCEASVNILQQQVPEPGDGEKLTLIGAVCFHNGNPALAQRAFKTALRFFQELNQPKDVKVAQEQLNKLGKTPLYRLQSHEFTIRLGEQSAYKFTVTVDGKVKWSTFAGLNQGVPVDSRFPWNTIYTIDNLSRITKALSALLQRDNADAFIIFEEKETGKFIQFAGSKNEDLLLDLPSQTLSREEMARAKVLFEELGSSGPEKHAMYTDKSLEVIARIQTSFNMNFGRDFRRAAEVTLAVFERVYRFPAEFQLILKEN
jgi:tetratricopeptide (TPR) repeat protein